MRYTVVWKPEAQRRLANLWLNAADRRAVTAAADAIDKKLLTDPGTQGESRPGGRRILMESPLGVLFKVSEQDRIVTVLTVWRFR
jgi:plasmid stabilization system protein ParE